MMLFWLGVLGLGSTHRNHHRNQLVYGSFASQRMCLSKCPIKMIQNENEYLTFAFGALSGLGLVAVPSDSDLFDARCLHFLLSPNSKSPNSSSLEVSHLDGKLGNSNSLPLFSNWSSYWLRRALLYLVGELGHSTSGKTPLLSEKPRAT